MIPNTHRRVGLLRGKNFGKLLVKPGAEPKAKR
jgi:NADPH-dependent curcumin reductase CurA